MERSLVLLLIAVALAAYGVWQAFYAIAMLPGLVSPLLFLAFALQALLAIVHVAYARPPLTREQRADQAKPVISSRFDTKQQAFLDFVLSHYVSDGVYELDQEKLTPLLRLRYRDSIADAVADLGQPEEIGRVFASFQKYLYQSAT